jgi:peptidoglycan/LPS O-acetylase OafA/YrhL
VPLVLPLFVWRGLTRLSVVVLAVALWVLGLWAHPREPVVATWHLGLQYLAVYSLCFLVGIAIAKFDWRPREGWIFVGLGLCYLLPAMYFQKMNYHVGYALLYGGLVMLAFVPGSLLQRGLSKHLMLWIGERSYSLFLIHFTVFFAVNYAVSHFVTQKDLTYFVLSRGIGLPLALLGAMLLFHFIERRFARNLITANEFWPPLATAMQGVRNPPPRVSSI